MADLSTVFTGIRFENPFLLASAPPTESESNIVRAFEAGWGGVVTKTIGLHPVVNVRGPRTKFLRADNARGWTSLADFRGIRRGNVVPHSEIGRPGASDYHGGYDETEEGYAGAPAR